MTAWIHMGKGAWPLPPLPQPTHPLHLLEGLVNYTYGLEFIHLPPPLRLAYKLCPTATWTPRNALRILRCWANHTKCENSSSLEWLPCYNTPIDMGLMSPALSPPLVCSFSVLWWWRWDEQRNYWSKQGLTAPCLAPKGKRNRRRLFQRHEMSAVLLIHETNQTFSLKWLREMTTKHFLPTNSL